MSVARIDPNTGGSPPDHPDPDAASGRVAALLLLFPEKEAIMRHRPALALTAALALLTLGPRAQADGVFVDSPSSAPAAALVGQRADIARELPFWGYHDVDVTALSTGQVAHISHLVHSSRSQSEIRNQIGATLRRGFLQRTVDRLFQ